VVLFLVDVLMVLKVCSQGRRRTAEFPLTGREWQVLKVIREGHSLQYIAVKTENSYRKVMR